MSVADATLGRTMNVSHLGQSEPLAQRLSELRGRAPQRSLDARALAALAANPGCRRRSLLDAAGVDKAAVAKQLGRPAPFGQSPFALARGNVFEARLKQDGYAALLEPLRRHLGLPAEDGAPLAVPDLLRRSSPRCAPIGRPRSSPRPPPTRPAGTCWTTRCCGSRWPAAPPTWSRTP
ncbi:hypothetical protein GCM10025734_33420 [Kitasatospora paranensis]